MKKLSLRSAVLLCLSLLFVAGLAVFVTFYFVNADRWVMHPSNTQLYTNGQFTGGGKITDCNGTVLAKTKKKKRIFNSSQIVRMATLHTVGDVDGYISTGIHTSFRKQLAGYNIFTGLFPSGGHNDIKLTIDSDVCAAAYNALGYYNGTVGVYNYKTGETICMVSKPSYDVNSEYSLNQALGGDLDGVFLNRFISSSYAPGSTFKIVTATAAIENLPDVYKQKYTCKSGTVIDGEKVTCAGWHGKTDLKNAFADSCNAYFAKLSVALGKDVMTEYAEKFGVNSVSNIDGIEGVAGNFDVTDANNVQLGWSGIGQYTDTVNPLKFMTAVGGIANGGVPIKPYIVKNIKTSSGFIVKKGRAVEEKRICSEETAEKVKELMDGAVKKTYGKGYFGALDVCGKTGTAEVDGKTPHAEFVGFCTNENYPFAFYVVVENGGSGNYIAKYVANQVLQAAKYSYDNK